MSLYVRDGFEHGDIGVYSVTTGSPAFVTSPVRTGNKALEIASVAANESVGYNLPTGNRQVTQSFYIRLAAFPDGTGNLASFVNASGNHVFRLPTGNSQFEVIVAAGTPVVGGPTVALDTWYLIDLFADSSTGTASIACKVDGGTEFSASRVQAAADITVARIGQTNANTVTMYYDDWGVSVTNGDYPIGVHAYTDPTLTQRVGPDRRAGN